MPSYVGTSGTPNMDDTYDPSRPNDVVTVGHLNTVLGAVTTPVTINSTTIPAGTVGQRTQYVLDISGTLPFSLEFSVPTAYVGSVTIRQLAGGSWLFDALPPNRGDTADVDIDIDIVVWNSHPSTNYSNRISQTFTWTIHPSAVDVSWNGPSSLPDGEVGVPYTVYADIAGTGPVTFARQAGLTTAQLTTAGLTIIQGAVTSPSQTPFLSGTFLPGAENTLGSSLTVRATGLTGVPADKVYASGITVRRAPGITITALPTIVTASGSLDLTQYLVGYPTTSITRDTSSPAWPSGFSLAANTITWTGLTDAGNGSTDMVFLLSNGYHPDQLVTLVLNRAVPAVADITTDVVTSATRSGANEATSTVSHAASSSGVDGVIMAFCTNNAANAETLASATYGGVNVPVLVGLIDGNNRDIGVAFLGSNVPQGTQNAVFTWGSANTFQDHLVVITLKAGGKGLQVQDSDTINGTAANTSQQSVLGGALCRIFAFLGINVAATTNVTDPGGVTRLVNTDQGTSCWIVYSKDTNTSADYTLSLTHASAARVFYQLAISAAVSQALSGAQHSWSRNGLANGSTFSALADNTEVTGLNDLASGSVVLNKAQGTATAQEGPRSDTTNKWLEFRDGSSDTLSSVGFPTSLGNQYWVCFLINTPDTQQAGDRCFFTNAGSNFYFNRGGATSFTFKIKAGSASFSATACDSASNVLRLLMWIKDTNTCGIAYATSGATFTYDSGDQTVTGIGIANTTAIFNPGSLGPADFNIQAYAYGTGAPNKTTIAAWLDAQSATITPPTPPPDPTAFDITQSNRRFSPELTWNQLGAAIRTGWQPPHGAVFNQAKAQQNYTSGGLIFAENYSYVDSNNLLDINSNALITRNVSRGGLKAYRHEIRSAWPTWQVGNDDMRSRLYTTEVKTGSAAILRNTKTYWVAYSWQYSSESDHGASHQPWPLINQLILDWKQPSGSPATNFNSQPRLEITPSGIIRQQVLRLASGTAIQDDGSNASSATLFQETMQLDTWMHCIYQWRLAGRASNNPIFRMWRAWGNGTLQQVINDSAPNSYEYLANPYTYIQLGIYNWDSDGYTPWVKCVQYSGRFILVDDGTGNPTPENLLAALKAATG